MRSLWDFFIQSYSVLFFKFSRIASLFDMPILGKPPETGSTAVSATIIPMRLRLLFRLQRSLLHLNSVGSYCPENGIHNFSYPLQSVHQLKYLFRSAMPSNLPDRLPAVVPMYIRYMSPDSIPNHAPVSPVLPVLPPDKMVLPR